MTAIDWVEIPRGKCIIGLSADQISTLMNQLPDNTPPQELERLHNLLLRESPEYSVDIETFYMSRYPINNSQYLGFANSSYRYADINIISDEDKNYYFDDLRELANDEPTHPVQVDWHTAMAFCESLGGRLPTSLEWEKAVRGTDGRLYPWGNDWDSTKGNFSRSSMWKEDSSVDGYFEGQSPYGIYHMIGNLFEWTISTSIGIGSINPLIPTELIICRGCSYKWPNKFMPDWFCGRTTSILKTEMNFGGLNEVGFRPVLDKWHRQFWPGANPIG